MADTRETMSSLLSIASSGLQAAQLRLNASAHNVANLNTPGFKGQTVQQQAVPPTGGVQARTAQAARPGVALEAEAVEQITASYAFKANALVLRSTQSMLGSLLDLHA